MRLNMEPVLEAASAPQFNEPEYFRCVRLAAGEKNLDSGIVDVALVGEKIRAQTSRLQPCSQPFDDTRRLEIPGQRGGGITGLLSQASEPVYRLPTILRVVDLLGRVGG